MNAHTKAPTEAVRGNFRPRPYLGRYVPSPLPEKPAPRTVAERIAFLLEAIELARVNARLAFRSGDMVGASRARFRAHEYVERIRELRTRL